jgi:DNA-binding CsgD family transcriptional regulator
MIGGRPTEREIRRRSIEIWTACLVVLALAILFMRPRLADGAELVLVPVMLVLAGAVFRKTILAGILLLSLADLIVACSSDGEEMSEIVILGLIFGAAAGAGIVIGMFSTQRAHPSVVGPTPESETIVTGRAHRSAATDDGQALAGLLAKLSRRERDVALLILDGHSAREIGKRLFISERTVETHMANIYDKLNVHSRRELVEHLRSGTPVPTAGSDGKRRFRRGSGAR